MQMPPLPRPGLVRAVRAALGRSRALVLQRQFLLLGSPVIGLSAALSSAVQPVSTSGPLGVRIRNLK